MHACEWLGLSSIVRYVVGTTVRTNSTRTISAVHRRAARRCTRHVRRRNLGGLVVRLAEAARDGSRAVQSTEGHSGAHETTNTYKTCLTKEKMSFDKDEKNCTRTILTSTSSKVAVKLQCSQPKVQSNATMEFEALSPENVKGSGHVVVTGEGHTMNLDGTYTGKWIGSACGDVK